MHPATSWRSSLPITYRRILVPIDDSPLSKKALDTAYSVATRFGAHVVVLYVRAENRVANIADQRRDESEYDFELRVVRETAHQALADGGHTLPRDHVKPDVRTGNPVSCIVEAAVEHQADLVVMGTHGQTSFSDRLIGTMTERVLLQGTCSLLVVREDRDQDVG